MTIDVFVKFPALAKSTIEVRALLFLLAELRRSVNNDGEYNGFYGNWVAPLADLAFELQLETKNRQSNRYACLSTTTVLSRVGEALHAERLRLHHDRIMARNVNGRAVSTLQFLNCELVQRGSAEVQLQSWAFNQELESALRSIVWRVVTNIAWHQGRVSAS